MKIRSILEILAWIATIIVAPITIIAYREKLQEPFLWTSIVALIALIYIFFLRSKLKEKNKEVYDLKQTLEQQYRLETEAINLRTERITYVLKEWIYDVMLKIDKNKRVCVERAYSPKCSKCLREAEMWDDGWRCPKCKKTLIHDISYTKWDNLLYEVGEIVKSEYLKSHPDHF